MGGKGCTFHRFAFSHASLFVTSRCTRGLMPTKAQGLQLQAFTAQMHVDPDPTGVASFVAMALICLRSHCELVAGPERGWLRAKWTPIMC